MTKKEHILIMKATKKGYFDTRIDSKYKDSIEKDCKFIDEYQISGYRYSTREYFDKNTKNSYLITSVKK